MAWLLVVSIIIDQVWKCCYTNTRSLYTFELENIYSYDSGNLQWLVFCNHTVCYEGFNGHGTCQCLWDDILTQDTESIVRPIDPYVDQIPTMVLRLFLYMRSNVWTQRLLLHNPVHSFWFKIDDKAWNLLPNLHTCTYTKVDASYTYKHSYWCCT